ncbi:hypothetical protein A8C32_03020 [Flavivirga aquatica]|uniref:Type IX secretion system membrane protein PorP/SprF n=1 Tax=Flavivirga aquatica TaxID=1849968 RepID=A0A1E5TAL5_9FLAO|nr:type IX secretion system membrane protein PorP/SprF [Flavivirga aquatica]OEK08435.1 hypothetical protein A8C32_03020 [Flavivirga aquatica]
MTQKLILLLAFICITTKISAQQNPQFTQYMYNMNVINPAYTTSDVDVLSLGLIHRIQWTGFKGPETSSVFAHKAINEKIELGLSYTRDQFNNFLSNNFASADFAYKINMNNSRVLSFGMKAGVNFYDFDPSGIILETPREERRDPAFDAIDKTFFNLGAGVYYNTDKFYLGLSVPNFLGSDINDDETVTGKQEIHTYLTSGYVFKLSDKFKLKPAFMTQYVEGAPLSLDVTGNVLYNDRLELGVGYRLDESISGLINIRVTPSLRIGYAYDHVTSDINVFTNASHEFILLYDLGLLFKKGYEKSPRFF